MNDEIRLEGAPNFRDIGGHCTRGGRRLKTGRIFRSGELSQLTAKDLEIIEKLGIGLVVDLRDASETKVLKSCWPANQNTRFHNANINLDFRLNGRSIIEIIIEQKDPDVLQQIVGQGFPLIAEHCAPVLRTIAEFITQHGGPVLFHCTNGRDRTGVVAALLLYLLDMPHEVITADFMLTNQRLDVEKTLANTIKTYREVMGVEMTRETLEPLTLVKESYINVMISGLESKYGSMENYLNHFGIEREIRTTLQESLLIPTNMGE